MSRSYRGFVGLLYVNDRFVSIADNPEFVPSLDGLIALSNRVQGFFRSGQWWSAVLPPCRSSICMRR